MKLNPDCLGIQLLQAGIQLFPELESWNSTFKILVRTLHKRSMGERSSDLAGHCNTLTL